MDEGGMRKEERRRRKDGSTGGRYGAITARKRAENVCFYLETLFFLIFSLIFLPHYNFLRIFVPVKQQYN